MSSYFTMYWQCGNCICGAIVDERLTAEDKRDILSTIRDGRRVGYQRGGSVSLKRCDCTHVPRAAAETEACQHDLQQPNTTIEVSADGLAAKCHACSDVWTMI